MSPVFDETAIATLIRDFEARILSRSQSTHHAHLIVALWYLLRSPPPEATKLIRQGIQRYNLELGH